MSVLSYFVTCYIFVSTNEAARILAVIPTPSISHQVVFRPLTQELAKRGHDVTIITPDPIFKNVEPPPNIKEIDVCEVSYRILWEEIFIKQTSKGVKSDIVGQMTTAFTTFTHVLDAQLKTKEVQSLINDKEKQYFDLLLLEACVRPAIGFSHIYKHAAVIQLSSLGGTFNNYEAIGAATHPILYPNFFHQRIFNLTFWDKIQELYNHYQLVSVFDKNVALEDSILQKHFGPDIQTVNELINNVDMLFLNIHPLFEGIRPVPPSVVYIDGLHLKPPKELPLELKSYLDSSKHGVIYFSFGTNVAPSLLPPERIAIFTKVFSQLPYDVLWKWDTDELPGRSANIRIEKWLPQSDLLRHPKIKAFIMQGGLQSTDEAIVAGVPLIGFPMLADQWFNVEKYGYYKIGIQLDIETVTEKSLKNAIRTVIEDVSYRRNIEKLRKIIQDSPQPPLERAVWWTEYVLRHGGGAKHLRSPAANISWAEYLELELVLTLLAGLLPIITVLVCAMYKFKMYLIQKYLNFKII